MGIFGKKKKEKDLAWKLKHDPKLKSMQMAQEFENMVKQVGNLVAVERKEDVLTVYTKFLERYFKKAPGEVADRRKLAAVGYKIAFTDVPELVYGRWEDFQEIWSGVIPPSAYFALKGALSSGDRISVEDFGMFRDKKGKLSNDLFFYLIAFPPPPEPGGVSPEELMELMKAGKPLDQTVVPILGPYFSLVLHQLSTDQRFVFTLGRRSEEEARKLGGTTYLRECSSGGTEFTHHGLSPNATEEAFVETVLGLVRERGVS